MPFSFIPFLLLVIPLMEIAAFVVIGGQIGVFPTLGLVVVTAIIGSILLRVQGFGLLNRIQTEMNANRVPGRDLVQGVMILIAGVLLLTPGFVTDSVGFLLFVPAFRDAIWAFVRRRIKIVTPGEAAFTAAHRAGASRHDSRTIDLDAEEFTRAPDPNSPWGEDDTEPKR